MFTNLRHSIEVLLSIQCSVFAPQGSSSVSSDYCTPYSSQIDVVGCWHNTRLLEVILKLQGALMSAWVTSSSSSIDAWIDRIEKNELRDLVVLPTKAFGSDELDRLTAIFGDGISLRTLAAS